MIGAANRDERKYTDPDRYDMFREQRQHVGFGFGVHVCLGMHLARMESRVAINTLLDRLGPFTLGPRRRATAHRGSGLPLAAVAAGGVHPRRLGSSHGRRTRKAGAASLQIRIDWDRCMGSGNCQFWAPDSFDLSEDGHAVVTDPAATDEERLRIAAQGMPGRRDLPVARRRRGAARGGCIVPIAVSEDHEALRIAVQRWAQTHCPASVPRGRGRARARRRPAGGVGEDGGPGLARAAPPRGRRRAGIHAGGARRRRRGAGLRVAARAPAADPGGVGRVGTAPRQRPRRGAPARPGRRLGDGGGRVRRGAAGLRTGRRGRRRRSADHRDGAPGPRAALGPADPPARAGRGGRRRARRPVVRRRP